MVAPSSWRQHQHPGLTQNGHLAAAVIYHSAVSEMGHNGILDSEESTPGAEQQGTNAREEQQETRQTRARFGRTEVSRHGRAVQHQLRSATRQGEKPAAETTGREGAGPAEGSGSCQHCPRPRLALPARLPAAAPLPRSPAPSRPAPLLSAARGSSSATVKTVTAPTFELIQTRQR